MVLLAHGSEQATLECGSVGSCLSWHGAEQPTPKCSAVGTGAEQATPEVALLAQPSTLMCVGKCAERVMLKW